MLPVVGVGVLETEISTDDDVIGVDISPLLVDVVDTLVECTVVSVLILEVGISSDISIL